MEKVIDTLQLLFALGAIGAFFIGIIKPSVLIKKKFRGRRLLFIVSSFVLLILVGILQDYKIEHVYTEEEREQYYAEQREQAVQDSIKREQKQREKIARDSIKLLKDQQAKLEKNKPKATKENKDITQEDKKVVVQEDIDYSQYLGVISNVKYKNKKIIGIGMEALKKKDSRYEIVTFVFKNNTNHVYTLSSDYFRLYDGENYYSISLDAQIEAEVTTNIIGAYTLLDIIDEVNPQMTRKYKLIFEVPKKGDYKLLCTDENIFIKHQ